MAVEMTIDLSEFAGFPVWLNAAEITLAFGAGVTSEPMTQRRIADIREMLPDPHVTGPDPLYSIYMDLKVPGLTDVLNARGLSFGAVVDAPGTIGTEYVRSQGHTHSSPSGSTIPYLEIYEFWFGTGAVYLQDRAEPETDEIYLVNVEPGDKLIIPPGWVHIAVNSGSTALAFGALYASDAELIYDGLRAMNGAAWRILADGSFEMNQRYNAPPTPLVRAAAEYPKAGIRRDIPIPVQAEKQQNSFDYVVDPENHATIWQTVIDDLREQT